MDPIILQFPPPGKYVPKFVCSHSLIAYNIYNKVFGFWNRSYAVDISVGGFPKKLLNIISKQL